MFISPHTFLRALSDETRLRIMNLLHAEGEMCVCELTHSLNEAQPKISRHLAIMRDQQVLTDRRQGQWVFYQMNKELPNWSIHALEGIVEGVSVLDACQADVAALARIRAEESPCAKPGINF